MVEGKGAAVVQDMPHHAIQIRKNIDSFDPQNLNPLFPQPMISPFIMRNLLGVIMPAAVDLDRQVGRSTVKIQHIRPNRMLAAKLQPLWSLSQPLPQRDFGW